jgi:lysyl-tRNA synthetase class 2
MYEFDADRLDKVEGLRKDGVSPYPHNLSVTHTASEVVALMGDRDNEALGQDETEVTIAGRLMFRNLMGKAGFARIQDRTGRVQIYIKKDIVGEEAFALWKKFDLGDHIHVSGTFMRTRTGEATISARTISLAGKCIASLPDKYKGITFRRRSEVVRYTREFFADRDYLEVETPMMHVIPGGATARPFTTHHNALDMELYMRVAPELYLKRLVVGGFERVFEINRNFRNEGVSTKHNPEFTMLEFYETYQTWHGLMELTEDLVSGMAQHICGTEEVAYGDLTLNFAKPWRRVKMSAAIAQYAGMTAEEVTQPDALRERWLKDHPKDAGDPKLPTTVGKWYELFMDGYVEENLQQPTFITHFPVEISPLSRRSETEDGIAERFELFIAGKEIANGFNELNDPVDQADRFMSQVESREAGDDEAMYFDSDYIRALTYGLPPTAGEGLGIDRLVMLLTNRQSIREVILFPTLRPEKTLGPSTDSEESSGD